MKREALLVALVASLSLGAALGSARAAEDGLDARLQALAKEQKFQEAAGLLSRLVAPGGNDETYRARCRRLIDLQIRAGQTLSATHVCEDYLRRFPDDANAQAMRRILARLYEGQGNFADAVATYVQIAAREQDAARAVDDRCFLARFFDRTINQPNDAVREYEKFVAAAPKDPRVPDVQVRLGQLYRSLRKYEPAADWFSKYVDAHPGDERARQMQNQVTDLFGDNGLRDYAREALAEEKYLRLFPKADDLASHWYRLAWIYHQRLRQYQKAIDAYAKACELRKTDDARWYWMELVRSTAKEPAARVAAVQAYLKDFPESGRVHQARRYLVEQLWADGKQQPAVDELRRMIKDYSDDNQWEYQQLTWSYLRAMKKYNEAFDATLDCMKALPREAAVPGQLIYIAYEGGEPKNEQIAAIQDAVRAQLKAAPHARILWHLANDLYYSRRKDYPAAARTFEEMLLQFPNDDYANRNNGLRMLVESYKARKQPEDAIPVLRKVAAANPDKYSENARYALVYVAQVLYDAKKYPEALAEAGKIVDVALDDTATINAEIIAARCHDALKQREPMLRAYAQAAHARVENWLNGVHGLIDQDRRGVLQPLLKEYEPPAKPAKGKAKADAKEEAAPKEVDRCERAMLYHALGRAREAVADYDACLKDGKLAADRRKVVEALRADADYLAHDEAYRKRRAYDQLPTRTLWRLASDLANSRRRGDIAAAAYGKLAERHEALKLDALVAAANAYYDAGDFNVAIARYRDLIKAYPKDLPVSCYHRLAWAWLERVKDAKVLGDVREIVYKKAEENPGDGSLQQYAVRLAYEAKPYEDDKAFAFLPVYEKDLGEQDFQYWIWNVARDIYDRQNKQLDAAHAILAWVKRHPDHGRAPWAYYEASYRLARAGKGDELLAMAREAQAKFPHDGSIWNVIRQVGNIDLYRKWIADNPTSGYNPEAEYRIIEIQAGQKDADRAAIEKSWRDHMEKYLDSNGYAATSAGANLIRMLDDDKKPDEALKVCETMVKRGPMNDDNVANCALRLADAAHDKGDRKRAIELAAAVADNSGNWQWLFYARQRLVAYDREIAAADPAAAIDAYLDAAIQLGRQVRYMYTSHDGSWDMVITAAAEANKIGRHEVAAGMLRYLLKHDRTPPRQFQARIERLMSEALLAGGGQVETIDPNLPYADLLRGDIFARGGEEDLAFQKHEQNLDLFAKYHHLLSVDYHLVIGKRLLNRSKAEDAIDMARTYLVRNQDNKKVSAEDRARIQLFLGDCYRADNREELARDEYRTCINLYKDTPEAVDAQFRTGESFLVQKMFGSAEEIFNELSKSPDRAVMVRAMLMRGVLLTAMDRPKESQEEFRKALALNPPPEIANELFFRLGQHYKDAGQLKKAYTLLRLVGSVGRDAKRTIEPGKQLMFSLNDQDLSIVRDQAAVPIVVKTTAGDEETVKLHPAESGSGIFVGEMATELGAPKPGDGRLQVKGGDTISYTYAAEFLKDFRASEEALKPREIRIASDAELKVSAREIPEAKGEGTDAAGQDVFIQLLDANRRGQRQFRNDKQVKPGNNIYVRLVDPDMSATDQRDVVTVVAAADSGDSVSLKLTETTPDSGVFRAILPTAPRPPDATASDETTGNGPLRALDGNRKADDCWIARQDGRVPKWFDADMKELYPISRIVWHRGEGATDRGIIRYMLLGSEDGKNWLPLAIVSGDRPVLPAPKVLWNYNGYGSGYPPEYLFQSGGDVLRQYWLGRNGNDEYIIDIDLGAVMPLAQTVLRPAAGHERVRHYELYAPKGPDAETYPGQKPELDAWEQVYSAAEERDPDKDDSVEWKGRKTRYVRLRVKEYHGGHPSIGEFEIYPQMSSTVTPSADAMGATIDIKDPQPLRHLRLLILEYRGDAPAIAEFAAFAGDRQIAPKPGVNVLELARNDTLEITPGDKVSVTYVDENNMSYGYPKALRDGVDATFYNGAVQAIRHQFELDANGNRQMIDYQVQRIEPGKRFIVQVVDYDADTSENVDTVPIKVETSSGQALEMTATETGPFTGTFTKEVDTAAPPAPAAAGQPAPPASPQDTLILKPGDTVTVSFLDKENTSPGNATWRKMALQVNEPTEGSVRIVGIETKLTGDAAGPVLVALDQPLAVEVIDSDRALDRGSKVKVSLRTSGGAEAEVECVIADNRTQDANLKAGRFTGFIPLRLGDKNSPNRVLDLETLRQMEAAAQEGRQTQDTEGILVLNVSGSDTIEARYTDDRRPKGEPAVERTASARLASNAQVGFYDDKYENRTDALHVGDFLYIKVVDPDASLSAEKDSVPIVFESSTGDRLTVQLSETLNHSGIFTRSILLEQNKQPDPNNDKFEADYDSTVKITYQDVHNTESKDLVARVAQAKVVIGSDADIIAFGKKYPNVKIAVETQFKIGKSYFELGKTHAALAEQEKDPAAKEQFAELAKKELGQGHEVLSGLMRAYPDNEYIAEIAFLLAEVAQEEKRYGDAIEAYERITRDFPDQPTAADAQYRVGVCHEKRIEEETKATAAEGRTYTPDYEAVFEAYVQLAYRYPKSKLVGDAMIRIGLLFFKSKEYDKAIHVFTKYLEQHPDHVAYKDVWFKKGLALILAERYAEAGAHLEDFVARFHNASDDMKAAAFFWAGDAYEKGRNLQKAYQMFKRVVWDYAPTKWAKWARGRLTADAYQRIEE